MENKYIYVVISQTHSKFAKLIRKITKNEYNHASISFDENLNKLYSFARVQNRVPLVAKCVLEFPERFYVNPKRDVKVKIFKIPVSEQDYNRGLEKVNEFIMDNSYIYNLFSVITYPALRGAATYKAFTCAEFVTFMLRYMNVHLNTTEETAKLLPQALCDSITSPVHYEGSLKKYCPRKNKNAKKFFARPEYRQAVASTLKVLFKLCYRQIVFRNLKYDPFLDKYVKKDECALFVPLANKKINYN